MYDPEDKVLLNPRSNKVMNICGANKGNGAKIIVWPQAGAWNEIWTYDKNGDMALKNPHSGKLIDIGGGNKNDGAEIITWGNNGGWN